MKIDTKTKIVLMHVGVLLALNLGCFVWAMAQPENKHDFGFNVLLGSLIYVFVDFWLALLLPFIKKLEKGAIFAHWIGFGLVLLLSIPTCLVFSDFL